MNIKDMLPFLIPLVIVELILVIITLRHIFTHQHYKRGARAFWVVMTIVGMTVWDLILYFLAWEGRNDLDWMMLTLSHVSKRFGANQVIDEAQYIKNHGTQAAKSVRLIQSGFRMALTGTPMENRLSELWSIFDFLMPGFLYGYQGFREKFEEAIPFSRRFRSVRRLSGNRCLRGVK